MSTSTAVARVWRLSILAGLVAAYMATFAAPALAQSAAAAQSVRPPTLADLWDHRATFDYVTRFKTPTSPGGFAWYNTNNSLVVRGGTWYLFTKELFFDDRGRPGTICAAVHDPQHPDNVNARIAVRSSTDHGATWSAPVTAVQPKRGTGNECGAQDGDVYFDPDTNTWHALYQCQHNVGGQFSDWNMCHSTRTDSPMGLFADDPAN